jgi:hypothetical protein
MSNSVATLFGRESVAERTQANGHERRYGREPAAASGAFSSFVGRCTSAPLAGCSGTRLVGCCSAAWRLEAAVRDESRSRRTVPPEWTFPRPARCSMQGSRRALLTTLRPTLASMPVTRSRAARLARRRHARRSKRQGCRVSRCQTRRTTTREHLPIPCRN